MADNSVTFHFAFDRVPDPLIDSKAISQPAVTTSTARSSGSGGAAGVGVAVVSSTELAPVAVAAPKPVAAAAEPPSLTLSVGELQLPNHADYMPFSANSLWYRTALLASLTMHSTCIHAPIRVTD